MSKKQALMQDIELLKKTKSEAMKALLSKSKQVSELMELAGWCTTKLPAEHVYYVEQEIDRIDAMDWQHEEIGGDN